MATSSKKFEEIEQDLRKAISEIGGFDASSVKTDAPFKEIGVDSMMALEIMANLERNYKVQIQERDLLRMTNISTTIEIIAFYLQRS